MVNALKVLAHRHFLTGCDGVEKANALNVAAVTGSTLVAYNHMIKRAFFRSASGQTNLYHNISTIK